MLCSLEHIVIISSKQFCELRGMEILFPSRARNQGSETSDLPGDARGAGAGRLFPEEPVRCAATAQGGHKENTAAHPDTAGGRRSRSQTCRLGLRARRVWRHDCLWHKTSTSGSRLPLWPTPTAGKGLALPPDTEAVGVLVIQCVSR